MTNQDRQLSAWERWFGQKTAPTWAQNMRRQLTTQLTHMEEHIMSEVKAEIAAIGAQLAKAKTEIVGKLAEQTGTIADLEQKITDGTITVDDLAPLKAQSQDLDDIVADVLPEPPVDPEPPVEPEVPAEPETPAE